MKDTHSNEALLARRALAEKATPGPWKKSAINPTFIKIFAGNPPRCVARILPHEADLRERDQYINADHIAANDPATVISDIDEILRLQSENAKLREQLDILATMVKTATDVAREAWGGEIPSPLE